MIARRMFGTVRYGRTGAVVLVTSSPLLPNKVKTGSANFQVPAQGRGACGSNTTWDWQHGESE